MMINEEEKPSFQSSEYIQELMELHEVAVGFEQLGHKKERGDISEAKYKKKFRKSFRDIPKAAVIIRESKVYMANKSIESIFKLPAKKMEGMFFSSFIHPKERPKVEENYRNRMAGREEAEMVYPTIVLDRKSKSVPVKLQAAKINYLDKQVVFVLLERIKL